MANRQPRRMVACLSLLAVLGLAWFPSEHIHSRTEDGHHSNLVHRHFEAHHSRVPQSHVDHDDDDYETRWIQSWFITVASEYPAPAVDFVIDDLAVRPVRSLARWMLPVLHPSVHDPPSASSLGLRAPPTLSV